MNALLLLALLSASDAGAPASLIDLLEFNKATPQRKLDDWRRRADPGRRVILDRWLAMAPLIDSREHAFEATQLLVELALTYDDDDALKTIASLIELDDLQRTMSPDTQVMVPAQTREKALQKAVSFLRHTPQNETAWKLRLATLPQHTERERVALLHVLSQCIEKAPKVTFCLKRYEHLEAELLTPRCERGNLRKQLRWVRGGRELNPQDVAVLEFKREAPSDVLVKLSADAPDPPLLMIRTPMRDTDIQLFDGDQRIGYAVPPSHGERTFALRTGFTTLDEIVKRLCARPTVTNLKQ